MSAPVSTKRQADHQMVNNNRDGMANYSGLKMAGEKNKANQSKALINLGQDTQNRFAGKNDFRVNAKDTLSLYQQGSTMRKNQRNKVYSVNIPFSVDNSLAGQKGDPNGRDEPLSGNNVSNDARKQRLQNRNKD